MASLSLLVYFIACFASFAGVALPLCRAASPADSIFGKGARARPKLVPKFYQLEQCTDKPHSFHVTNATITTDRHCADHWNMDAQLSSSARSLASLDIILNRCLGSIGPSTCEYHRTLSRSAAVCDVLRMPGMMWTPIFAGMKPAFACPLHAGKYVLRNATVDLSTFDKACSNIETYIWQVEFHLNNERRDLFMCLKFGMQARRGTH